MSQVSGSGRRTQLSLTQPAKVKKSPTVNQAKINQSPPSQTQPDIVNFFEEAPFQMDNADLLNILASAEPKRGTPAAPSPAKNGDSKTPASNGNHSKGKESKIPELIQPKSLKKRLKDELNGSTTSKASLALEKDCRGFDEEGFEMESLIQSDDDDVVEVPLTDESGPTASAKVVDTPKAVAAATIESNSNVVYDSPRPNKTPGKVVRLAKGLRLSPFRKLDQTAGLDNISTMVNLSTVSEQSVEAIVESPVVVVEKLANDKAEEEESSSTDASSTGVGRRVSSRRTYSARPLREVSFRNATRETYRKIAEDENNDSVNVTIGSELDHSVDEVAVKVGEKRRAPDDSFNEEGEEEGAQQPPAKRSLFQSYCSIM